MLHFTSNVPDQGQNGSSNLLKKTQGLLWEMIPQERCIGSARRGGEAHLFGKRDRLMKRKWHLSGRVTSRRHKAGKQE